MGLSFKLKEGVFIPRPETELLVEKLLEHITLKGRKVVNILEIGTGCGNIAISLTKNIKGCKILASDSSDKTLRLATKNARLHGVRKRIKFIQSRLFDSISSIYYNYFDIIASNPPYIRNREIGGLQPEISHEDRASVAGGDDGLYFYRIILRDGVRYLKKDGMFAFEIGHDQASGIKDIIKGDERFSQTKIFKDYGGNDRVMLVSRERGKG
jgi:release factor glutamine methyltransferase